MVGFHDVSHPPDNSYSASINEKVHIAVYESLKVYDKVSIYIDTMVYWVYDS